MQKKHSQGLLSQTRISSRADKAEFARRCFLLGELLQLEGISEGAKEQVLSDMFCQSKIVIGIQ